MYTVFSKLCTMIFDCTMDQVTYIPTLKYLTFRKKLKPNKPPYNSKLHYKFHQRRYFIFEENEMPPSNPDRHKKIEIILIFGFPAPPAAQIIEMKVVVHHFLHKFPYQQFLMKYSSLMVAPSRIHSNFLILLNSCQCPNFG